MSGLRGNIGQIRKLSQLARSLPSVEISQRVAQRAAPELTRMARASFVAQESPYGDPWEPGVDGNPVTLRKTGALFGTLRFVAAGTRMRAALTVRYARYQIGKRKILPRGGAALPRAWSELIARIAREEIERGVRGA